MRLSILCVRDDLSIFYIGIFLGSSVLTNPFNGRLVCLRKLEFLYYRSCFFTFFGAGSLVVRNCTTIPKTQSPNVNAAPEFMEESVVIPMYSATPGRSPAAEEPHTIAEVRMITGRIYFTASTPTMRPVMILTKNWISPSNGNNAPAALKASAKQRINIPMR